MPAGSIQPEGDVVLADVPGEAASHVIEQLRRLGVDQTGSITVEWNDTVLSNLARETERIAPGAGTDAVVWETVRARAVETAEVSFTFAWFMMLAALIAAIGILTDSVILVIGAMVLGPEFGPMAGLALAALERRPRLAGHAAWALWSGFTLAIAAAAAGTLFFRAIGSAPSDPNAERVATIFISNPDEYTIAVALVAGIAGMLSLTTNRGGALIGVFISVTTIPAAADIGVGFAYARWDEVLGSSLQLVLNVVAILGAGLGTLWLQRWRYRASSLTAARR